MANTVCVRYFILVLRPTTIFSLRNETVTESPDTIAVELFCNISGNPLPEIPHKLIICKPRQKDTGFYTCLAKNQLANARMKAYLNVLCEYSFI